MALGVRLSGLDDGPKPAATYAYRFVATASEHGTTKRAVRGRGGAVGGRFRAILPLGTRYMCGERAYSGE